MAWSVKEKVLDDNAVSNMEVFSSAIDMTPDKIAHIQVVPNYLYTSIDEIIVSIYATLDSSSETWDAESIITPVTIDPATRDPWPQSFTVLKGYYKIRVGVKANGTSENIPTKIYVRTYSPGS